jgi:hypothetical protein
MNIATNIKKERDITRERDVNDPILYKKAELMHHTLSKKYPEILEAGQVAELLQLKLSTIRKWTMENIIPCTKLNGAAGAARYLLIDIIFWLLKNDKNDKTERVD